MAVAVAVLALGVGACGDDGDDAADRSSSTTTTTTVTTTEAPSTTGAEDPSTTAGSEPAGPTTSTTTTAPPAGSLLDRVGEVDGFELDISDAEDAFSGEHCDGSRATVTAAEEADATYEHTSGDGPSLGLLGMRFASVEHASTFYDELAATTAGCAQEGLTIDEGTATDIGDEGIVFVATEDGSEGESRSSRLFASRAGDEVWILTELDPGPGPEAVAPVLDAYTAAVEG